MTILGTYKPDYHSNCHSCKQEDLPSEIRYSKTKFKTVDVAIRLDPSGTTTAGDGASVARFWNSLAADPPPPPDIIDVLATFSDTCTILTSMRSVTIEYNEPMAFPLKPFTRTLVSLLVDLQVWRPKEGGRECVTARRVPKSAKDPPEWITVEGSFREEAVAQDSERTVQLKECLIRRGTQLNVLEMVAVPETGEAKPLKVRGFVMRFRGSKRMFLPLP
jgi:hypothetical protein